MAKNNEDKKLNHFICLDFETGGLDCQKDAVTEIGMVAYRADTFEEIASYQSYIRPNYTKKKVARTLKTKKQMAAQTELFNETAFKYDEAMMLKYTNLTLDILERKGKDIKVVATEVQDFMKGINLDGGNTTKPLLLGQNIVFDIGFLQQLADVGGMELNKVLSGKTDYHGNFAPDYFDTLHLCKAVFAHDDTVTSHKLGFLCELLGVELIEAHSALDDVYATGDLFKALLDRMRSEGAGIEIGGKKQEKFRSHFLF